jgi:hypothetical protein
MLKALELLCANYPGFVAMGITVAAVWLAVSLDGAAMPHRELVDAVGHTAATHAAPEFGAPLAAFLKLIQVDRSDVPC